MNKFVLITGASGGLGADFARLFAADGHSLILVARSLNKLNEVADEIRNRYKVEVVVYQADLSVRETVEELIGYIREKAWAISGLVNNAGFGSTGYFVENEWSVQDSMMELNMHTLTRLSYVFGGEMAKRGEGMILNIASNGAFQPAPNLAIYAATKAFVLHFSEALRYELMPKGVKVTCSCPGPTATGFHDTAGTTDSLIVKMGMLSSESVAKEAYRALKKNRQVIVHGWTNKLFAFSLRLVPRNWVPPMAHFFMK
jgi:short-subunit dehydrogenase